ncbi:MAG: glutamine--fructose-6-phosphate transaminase (isomerizing) [Simkania negevensis]|nr:glutamine--fructose-6-phosphate transaminase (isomerizing) [Simkania negevensis]
MCGIFGYVSPFTEKKKQRHKLSPVAICLEGLKRLEYRGYDSSGLAGISKGKIEVHRRAGKLLSLQQALHAKNFDFNLVIGHTRWATHGKPTEINAHPQFNKKQTLALVHNGIIENEQKIREKLKRTGVVFQSETDTEVIAELISSYYKEDLHQALEKALKELKGSFAIALIHVNHPNQIFAAARENPLVVGFDKKTQEGYLSSDPNTFGGKSLEISYLKSDEIAIIDHREAFIYDLEGKKKEKKTATIRFENSAISKNGYKHFMLKEIFEQSQTVQRTMEGRLQEEFGTAHFEELSFSPQELQSINRILILGCGTSYHAGSIASAMFEQIARIPAEAKIASEFRYTNPIISKGTLVIAISQSGETADTIAAIREAKAKGAKVLAICNVEHSTITREADSSLFLRAGPEISVCSTKAFTSQLTVAILFTLFMARIRHMGKEEGQSFLKELRQLPNKITEVLAQAEKIETFAETYAHFESFFFIGRNYMYPASQEAALKLKEISYLNAMGYPAGELKHGPIALINPKLLTIGMCGNEQTLGKMVSSLMEVKARSGPILAFAPKKAKELAKITPHLLFLPETSDHLSPITYSIAAQLFAYYIAERRGTEIDQPRNLAKSVTVE